MTASLRHEEGTRRLISELDPGLEAELLHLLTCLDCRDLARVLLERSPNDPDYDRVLQLVEDRTPELEEEARRRRKKAEGLLSELMALPLDRSNSPKLKRYQNADLLDLLVERSHAAQRDNPRDALAFSLMAVRLALHCKGDSLARPVLARAYCLAGNALRLAGSTRKAEVIHENAVPFLATPGERAFFARSLALLRWERGRLDEAEALLRHAAQLFADEWSAGEAGACLALLGLLRAENGDPRGAHLWLARGRRQAGSHPPWLAVRTGLTLALCLAQLGNPPAAHRVLAETRPLYGLVKNEDELVRVYWLEGRILSWLGAAREAAEILDHARRKLFGQGKLPEAALATLDYGLLMAEAGRLGPLSASISEFQTAFEDSPGLDGALEALSHFAELAVQGKVNLRDTAAETAKTLRHAFRLAGLPIEPLPLV